MRTIMRVRGTTRNNHGRVRLLLGVVDCCEAFRERRRFNHGIFFGISAGECFSPCCWSETANSSDPARLRLGYPLPGQTWSDSWKGERSKSPYSLILSLSHSQECGLVPPRRSEEVTEVRSRYS